jgi:lipopolysaccharide assembly outer membrane protein LptD (OstA)
MKFLPILSLALSFAAGAGSAIWAQRPTIRVQQALHNPEAIVMAVSATNEGDIFHLKGDVEIRTDSILLRADEANYNHATGEIDAHGDVKVTPTSPLISRGVSQLGIKKRSEIFVAVKVFEHIQTGGH